MKPMLKYRGGKSKEIQHFLDHMPDYHGRYVEPFFGGGALYFYLEPQDAIINDINTQLIGFYRGVAEDYQQVHEELVQLEARYRANRADFDQLKAQTPDQRVEDRNEGLYYEIRDMFNGIIPARYSPATIYYFINKTAYSGMIRYNARGEYKKSTHLKLNINPRFPLAQKETSLKVFPGLPLNSGQAKNKPMRALLGKFNSIQSTSPWRVGLFPY